MVHSIQTTMKAIIEFNLPEPSFEKVMVLIEMLKGITEVSKKRNLNSLLTPTILK